MTRDTLGITKVKMYTIKTTCMHTSAKGSQIELCIILSFPLLFHRAAMSTTCIY